MFVAYFVFVRLLFCFFTVVLLLVLFFFFFIIIAPPPISTLSLYTALFLSVAVLDRSTRFSHIPSSSPSLGI